MWPVGQEPSAADHMPAGIEGERVDALRVDAVPFERLGYVLLDDEHLVPHVPQCRGIVRPVGDAHAESRRVAGLTHGRAARARPPRHG